MRAGIRSVVLFLGSVGVLSAAVAWQGVGSKPGDADKPLPIPSGDKPQYYKGNLHTHSFWSDGDDFPEMIADWYKRNGYQFLALSDHNILSEGEKWIDAAPDESAKGKALTKYIARFGEGWVDRRKQQDKDQVRLKPLREFRSVLEEPGKYLLIPAEEITHKYAKNPVHLNGINLRDKITPLDGDSVSETIRVNLKAVEDQRKKTGWRMLASLNHPNWGWGVKAEDMAPLEDLRFFEVFNGHSGVKNYGDADHASVERMWDIVLALRLGKLKLPVVYGVATDDAHNYHAYGLGKQNPGRGWVMVRAPYLTAEAVVRGMESGDFYPSTGVVLTEVRREGGELRLSIRAEEGVKYRTQFIATMRDAPLDSKPHLDKDGKPMDVTRVYSDEVGKVVGESDDPNPRYKLTGKELYVRAKVISTKPHPNPYQKGDVEVAWTQPFLP